MTRSLRILHVVANLGPGGVQRHLTEALTKFDREQLDHTVCCVTTGGVYEKKLRSLGIPYHILRRRARFDPFVIWQLATLIRKGNIDVVHTHNFTANAWGRIAARLAGVPRIVAHERGTGWTENALMRWIDRRLYKITDVLLANSLAARTVLVAHVRVPSERIRVVRNGVLLESSITGASGQLRADLGLANDVPVVGCVGRLDTPKGLPFLVAAIPLILEQHPQTHFAIIGDGPLRGFLHAALSQFEQVHLLGFREDAPTLMRDLDVLLHPAIRESLGNVLIEAGLAGVPAVATNVDGIPEVIVDGETGVLISATEPAVFIPAPSATALPAFVVDGETHRLRRPLGPAPQALADAVVALLDEPARRAELGRRARQRIHEHFGMDRYVSQVAAVYAGDVLD